MSAHSSIEWTDATWNPVRGCDIVSKGCTNCYAMRQAHRQSGPGGAYEGLTQISKGGPVWTGKVQLVPELLDAPLRWRKPRRIFVNSMSDLFHEDVPDEFINKVFAVMALCPQHTFQILTKRPQRMREWFHPAPTGLARDVIVAVTADRTVSAHRRTCHYEERWPLPNAWLGVSVEDQASANERIPLLLQTPAAVRWISAEPLLGPIDIGATITKQINAAPSLQEAWRAALPYAGVRIDWVVVGGESGPGARPMTPDWARSLRGQCAAAGVPFFFKQWGSWTPYCSTLAKPESIAIDGTILRRTGKKGAGRMLDGRTHDEYPR